MSLEHPESTELRPGPVPPDLELDDAIELCTAWLQRLAVTNDARSLILKGRVLSEQGLRDYHRSADVDILIDPEGYSNYCDLLRAFGWVEFSDNLASRVLTTHSRTFRREGWPNSVDVHSSWPGFLRGADEVFNQLWNRRTTSCFAHQPCDVPDRVSNILILALHSLRGSSAQARHRYELEGLMHVRLDLNERRDVAALAVAVGATATLNGVLSPLGIDPAMDPLDTVTPAYRDWCDMVMRAGRRGRVSHWIAALSRASWPDKLVILRQAIWPTDLQLITERPGVRDRRGARIGARLRRLVHGAGQLPDAIWNLRQGR